MLKSEELKRQRALALAGRAEMQKLFVTGHLLPGADISAAHIRDFLSGLGKVCGMNIFDGPNVKSPDSYDAETLLRLGRPPEDVNGSVMWDDSGAQIYIFPTRGNWFTLDIYTCKRFGNEEALQYAYDFLMPREDMKYSTSTTAANSAWKPFTLPNGITITPEARFLPDIDSLFDFDTSKPDQTMTAGTSLEALVAKAIAEGCGERVAASYTQEQTAQLQEIHSAYEVLVDGLFMEAVLSGRAKNPDLYPFQPIYDRLSYIEAATAGIGRGKRVMHIGTGWPGTAIGMYRQFGIAVTCVEKDAMVAQKSGEALRTLGLLGEDRMQVLCADGKLINPEGYAAVIVSAMVPTYDKLAILGNMRRLALDESTDPLLILRTPPDRARAFFYQPLGNQALGSNALNLMGDTRPYMSPSDPLMSMVYQVRPRAEARRGSDRLNCEARERLMLPRELLAA
ncbi:class I SAM-dependent methyltransferase [Candidatus Woesearchaeota archaeon]|nr:class I SAM-dependent methyltransferase [Candidatus Woesearchaeota archaeon]